jgi:hypothetical protein
LLDWMRQEAIDVCVGTVTFLTVLFKRLGAGRPVIIEATAPTLAPFPTVDALLLYGIRDLLKVLLNQTALWRAAGAYINPRAELADDPRSLITTARDVFERGMVNLALLVETASPEAKSEFANFLSRYTAYVYTEVELGQPFLVKFRRVLPIGRTILGLKELKQAMGQTRVFLPLYLKDANSMHVAVALPDPEIRFGLEKGEINLLKKPRWIRIFGHRFELGRVKEGRRHHKVGDWSLRVREADGELKEVPLSQHFGLVDEASEQLVHFYSARGRYEGRQYDYPLGSVTLVVPLKLTLTVFGAYFLSALFFGVAATYAGVMWFHALVHERLPSHFDALLAVNALAITLSLWLTTTQHRRPIMHKKLLPARYAFFIAMFVLLVAPGTFGVYEIHRVLS